MNIKQIIDLGGIVTLDNISHLNQLIDTSLIVDGLKEDLFQATFPHDQIIDIGWYPEFCERGTFRISLIKNSDWEHPAFSEKNKRLDSAKNCNKRSIKKLER